MKAAFADEAVAPLHEHHPSCGQRHATRENMPAHSSSCCATKCGTLNPATKCGEERPPRPPSQLLTLYPHSMTTV